MIAAFHVVWVLLGQKNTINIFQILSPHADLFAPAGLFFQPVCTIVFFFQKVIIIVGFEALILLDAKQNERLARARIHHARRSSACLFQVAHLSVGQFNHG